MSQILFRRIELRDGCSYVRRIFFMNPDDHIEHPAYAARDMELLMDTDDDEPVITLPYDSTDEQFTVEDMRRCTMITFKARPGEEHQPSSGDYYVASSRPSLTAPDRFWEFRCVKNPFEHVDAGMGSRFYGRWDATQSPNQAKLPFVISSDTMKPESSVTMPHMPMMDTDVESFGRTRTFFIKISSTEYLGKDRQGNITKIQDTPTTYLAIVSEKMFAHVWHQGELRYPALGDIIGDIDNLDTGFNGAKVGLTPSSIVDISISERSPYGLTVGTNNADILDADGSPFHFLRLGQRGIGLHQIVGWLSASRTETLHWNGLTDRQYYTGAVSLYDTNDARIAALPVQIMKDQADIPVETIMDLTGLTTQITLPGGSRITMPEGKLPYVGSAWAEYAVAQRSYDRENMTLAIHNAKSEATQNLMMNAANGVLTGALIGGPLGIIGGVASTALNVAGSGMELQRNERTARAQQDMQEKMLMNSPGTSFNTGYGTDYVRRSLLGTCRIQVDLPVHSTQQMFDDYVAWHGYPAGGLYSEPVLQTGYFKGYLTETNTNTDGVPKHIRDMMNKELTEGVRFV